MGGVGWVGGRGSGCDIMRDMETSHESVECISVAPSDQVTKGSPLSPEQTPNPQDSVLSYFKPRLSGTLFLLIITLILSLASKQLSKPTCSGNNFLHVDTQWMFSCSVVNTRIVMFIRFGKIYL